MARNREELKTTLGRPDITTAEITAAIQQYGDATGATARELHDDVVVVLRELQDGDGR